MKQMKVTLAAVLVLMLLTLTACGGKEKAAEPAKDAGDKKLTDVKIALDWTPNTNHTGIYVAKEKGYFTEQGLNVDIVLPGSNTSMAMVGAGNAEFGIGVQESITQGRLQGVPVVSIGAIIQHNTSGFASPVAKNIKSPKDFEGKKYGGYGSPAEAAVIESLMQTQNADYKKVTSINIGEADYFTAVKRDVDFSWIYYAWTGIEAELRKEPVNMIYLTDYSDKLDYYTPVVIASEKLLKEKPELAKAFMAAVSKGYEYAIASPEDAANILIKAVPELNKELVIASQKWLSPRYKAEATRWGEQKRSVWENYSNWMFDHKLLEKKLDVDTAFTNDFLPKAN
ncbi:ABC transporter substrate-binding protein [Paenibacillus sp. N1-5-1-14]|uniref:ABC transporter substrate-binding protein n=1 Tax=Paenibacillus radicibacter TaxID=2972488 RepID=UPI0021592C7D|nr:ABC transporter substrate-binding protein [Paenibacillus radicibacter]MCR8642075.1 ABC transporter substrate-binding protein [Paenibacillus radicibacter]